MEIQWDICLNAPVVNIAEVIRVYVNIGWLVDWRVIYLTLEGTDVLFLCSSFRPFPLRR